MGIIRDTLVGIFAKPDDEDGMTVPIRCVNTVEELAEYDAELAQAAQRQTEAETTQREQVFFFIFPFGFVHFSWF